MLLGGPKKVNPYGGLLKHVTWTTLFNSSARSPNVFDTRLHFFGSARRHVEVKLHGPLEEPETKVNVKLLVNSKKMLEKQKLEEDVGEAEAEANPTTIILLRHHRSIQ
jgi:hypothetical protein